MRELETYTTFADQITPKTFFAIEDGFSLSVEGEDATQIANNLTTNDVKKLSVGESCETFITNVRGWTVAHAIALRTESGFVFLGIHPEPSLVADHFDRYIIREDARVAVQDIVLLGLPVSVDKLPPPDDVTPGAGGFLIPRFAFGMQAFLATSTSHADAVKQKLLAAGYLEGSDVDFEQLRIRSAWPKQGIEIGEKTIPQELDRDEEAISFTKGCYLGQETIARLDALGQLQKKLCLLDIAGTSAKLGDAITLAGKDVGTITSTIEADSHVLALAILKRSGFKSKEPLHCGENPVSLLS